MTLITYFFFEHTPPLSPYTLGKYAFKYAGIKKYGTCHSGYTVQHYCKSIRTDTKIIPERSQKGREGAEGVHRRVMVRAEEK